MEVLSTPVAELLATGPVTAVTATVSRRGQVVGVLRDEILAASVSADLGSVHLRSATLSLADPDGALRPRSATDLASPFGSEWALGVELRSGGAVLAAIPMGTYGVARYRSDGATGTITLDLLDRSAAVAALGFDRPVQFGAGTSVAGLVLSVVGTRLPWVTVESSLSILVAMATPVTIEEAGAGSDPWRLCTDVAASVGAECFFDRRGRLVLRPAPDRASMDAVAVLGDVIGWTADLDLAAVHNLWVVTAERAGAGGGMLRGTAMVLDPADPAHADNIGGVRPLAVSDRLVSDSGAAAARAQLLRDSQASLARGMSASVRPDPSLDVGDVVALDWTGERSDTWVVGSVGLDLSLRTPMTLALRPARHVGLL